jgi:hypothetical protein
MKLAELLAELQRMYDRRGDCMVNVANNKNDILNGCEIDRVCYFEDGESKYVIIVEL